MKGKLAIVQDGGNHVISTVSSFDQWAPGGCSLAWNQERLAKERAWVQVMQNEASPMIAAAIIGASLAVESIAQRLQSVHGWKVTVIDIDTDWNFNVDDVEKARAAAENSHEDE